MPFPPKDPNAAPKPRVQWGPNKSRKYVLWYVSRKKGGKDETLWSVGEYRGQHLKSAHNALVRDLRARTGDPKLKASDVLVMEAHILPPRTDLESYLDSLAGEE